MREDFFCCLLSKISYYKRNAIVNIFTNIPFSQNKYNLNSCGSHPRVHESDIDAECFTVECNKKLYVAFRGTESIRDWLSDANIIRVPMDLPGIADSNRPQVHWGFLRQFRSLENHIIIDVNDYLARNSHLNQLEQNEIVFTGHSLGAAQATLASLQFKLAYPNLKVSCYTYGSPRVGDSSFVSLFTHNVNYYKRVVNEEDPVTLIPFSWRFTHLPKMAYLDHNGHMRENVRENRWWTMLKDLCKSFVYGSDNPFSDHSCEDYYNKLEAINNTTSN